MTGPLMMYIPQIPLDRLPYVIHHSLFKCTPNIKALLFKSYCSNVYCVHLGANYAQYHLAKLSVLQ